MSQTEDPKTSEPKPSSPRRIASSRANGKLSKGPTTPAGLRACAKNPIKHGMLAQSVVLAAESESRFNALLDSFIAEHRPVTQSEIALVHKMVAAYWRLMRTWSIQKTDFDREMARLHEDPDSPPAFRATLAFGILTGPNAGAALNPAMRYETTYDRQFNRALRDLMDLKSLRDPTAGLSTIPASFAASTWDDPSENE